MNEYGPPRWLMISAFCVALFSALAMTVCGIVKMGRTEPYPCEPKAQVLDRKEPDANGAFANSNYPPYFDCNGGRIVYGDLLGHVVARCVCGTGRDPVEVKP